MTPAAGLAPARLDPPGQHHAGQPALAGGAGHPGHHLAAQRLVVEAALAGDHQVAGVQRRVEPVRRRTSPMPDSPRPPQASSAAPIPPAAPAPGTPDGRRAAGHVIRGRRRSAPARRPAAHVLSGGALLRPEDGAGAVQAGQRAVHVGGRDQPHRPQPGRPAQAAAPGQGRAAVRQGVAGVIQRGGAERGEHPGPGVVGRRAAQPDDDLPCAGLHRRGEQRAQPVRGGDLRVALASASRCRPQAWALST